jgi:glycopeptide antibiotics resistance protein
VKKKIIFALYIFFLLYFLIFSEIYGRSGVMQDYHYNITPFQEIERFWRYREQLGLMSYINLFGNVLIFMPFGFMEPLASNKRSFWATLIDGCLVSLAVEIFQFITKVGRFDVDDLMLNTIGVALGYMCFLVWNAIRRKYDTKE